MAYVTRANLGNFLDSRPRKESVKETDRCETAPVRDLTDTQLAMAKTFAQLQGDSERIEDIESEERRRRAEETEAEEEAHRLAKEWAQTQLDKEPGAVLRAVKEGRPQLARRLLVAFDDDAHAESLSALLLQAPRNRSNGWAWRHLDLATEEFCREKGLG